MATNPSRRLTADDVLQIPVPEELSGFELVHGRPVPVTPASQPHGRIAARVAYRLMDYVEREGIGGEVYVDALFALGLPRDPERARAPDVSFLRAENLPPTDDWNRVFRGVPDLAVEVDITTARKPGGRQRIADYVEAGVPLVWIIEPDRRTATVYRADGTSRLVHAHEELDGEGVLPGFRLPLDKLFR